MFWGREYFGISGYEFDFLLDFVLDIINICWSGMV